MVVLRSSNADWIELHHHYFGEHSIYNVNLNGIKPHYSRTKIWGLNIGFVQDYVLLNKKCTAYHISHFSKREWQELCLALKGNKMVLSEWQTRLNIK